MRDEIPAPRRACLDKMTPEEHAIRNAMLAVEDIGAHPELTAIVNDLQAARARLADHIDGVTRQVIEAPGLDPAAMAITLRMTRQALEMIATGRVRGETEDSPLHLDVARTIAGDALKALDALDESDPETAAAMAVLRERAAHTTREGYSDAHDDRYADGELARAAAAYSFHASLPPSARLRVSGQLPMHWPWEAQWWKPNTARRDLERAGALIIAELARLNRAEADAKHNAESPRA